VEKTKQNATFLWVTTQNAGAEETTLSLTDLLLYCNGASFLSKFTLTYQPRSDIAAFSPPSSYRLFSQKEKQKKAREKEECLPHTEPKK
jgi:hypothetical protein